MAKATNVQIYAETPKQLVATWEWGSDHTAGYEVVWWYNTYLGLNYIAQETKIDKPGYKLDKYTIPDDATKIWVYVTPISETYTVENGSSSSEVSYWTAEKSTGVGYYPGTAPVVPDTPSTPTLIIGDDKISYTVKLENISLARATHIEFQFYTGTYYWAQSVAIDTTLNRVSYTGSLTDGGSVTVRCRACNQTTQKYSDYSNWTDTYYARPVPPGSITSCAALSSTSVKLEWSNVVGADSYTIRYATKKEYLEGSDGAQTATGIETTYYTFTGLESGNEYFFQVQAVNENGESSWTNIVSLALGKAPSAPTTWSSTTTAVVGEDLTLYWVHNSEDGSSQTYANLEIQATTPSGTTTETYNIKKSTDEDEKDKTSHYAVNTSRYPEGSTLVWRVQTRGILDTYSPWSIQRTIKVYAKPTLLMAVKNASGTQITELTSFPFYISATATPITQTPVSYHVSISADSGYTTVNGVGSKRSISKGEAVYSKVFDTSEDLLIEMSAGNVDLHNNISYTVTCTVAMDSGLTAETSATFSVAWEDSEYEPNAEMGIDRSNMSAYIKPYCKNSNGDLVSGLTLSVYRREFDGTFTEIMSNLENNGSTFVTDPHPALDYARYRIVAKTTDTGAVSYYDLPAYPVGITSVVIQWNEEWSTFDVSNNNVEQDAWSGSILTLPYNIDVSSSYSPDYSLVEYIGRKHPVSYYGTQIGETANWNVDIEKNDRETLYALRRLAVWMGDVYVREPSGSGYWANVSVSFSQNHCELSIPVSLGITRVAGGA